MAAKKKSASRKPAAKKKAAKKKVAKRAQVSPAVADINSRIAILRNNLRDLTEQATAYSGASTEELMSNRIAEQEAKLFAEAYHEDLPGVLAAFRAGTGKDKVIHAQAGIELSYFERRRAGRKIFSRNFPENDAEALPG